MTRNSQNSRPAETDQYMNLTPIQVIFHKKDENPSKEKTEKLGWRERRSQQNEDVEITDDVNDNEDKVCSVSLLYSSQSQPKTLLNLNSN